MTTALPEFATGRCSPEILCSDEFLKQETKLNGLARLVVLPAIVVT
jgi:hypothetical protein